MSLLDRIRDLAKNPDMAVAVGLVLILGVMIVPVPPLLLDFLISMSVASSIAILLMAIYTRRPLDFSSFPSVLLVTTLFRLGLNVATTRNILLRAGSDGPLAAGHIIQTFGDFVVGGNFAVGLIIFIILVLINFIVITKGAGRIAEVAARFTLDSMPGKQMAIDADLNAGLIKEDEAKRRRREVAAEADFYGAMDGASKFVRGDAIAGILITLVNIIGGIIVGVAQLDMGIGDASKLFTLLTVGDGLVSQIPALIISVAAGMIITRNTSENPLGQQIGEQFRTHITSFYIVAGVLFVLGLIGMPKVPFWGMGILVILLARFTAKANKERDEKQAQAQAKISEAKGPTRDPIENLLSLELLELEVGYALVNIVDADQNGDLLERISMMKDQFAIDWGIIVPSIRIKDNLELRPGGYSIRIKGIQVAKGELMPDYFLAMDPGTVVEPISGIATTEPVFGLNAVWITEDQREDAQYYGYTVVDISTIIATHITEVLKSNLHELLGRQELVRILDNFKERYPKIVTDLIPDILQFGVVIKVMQNLLREAIPVRDLRTILESLAENGVKTKDPDILTEKIREALYRTITDRIKSDKGDIPLFTLDRKIEESIANSIIQTDSGPQLSLDPRITQSILASLNDNMEIATNAGEKMVVLCSPIIRYHFKKLTEKFIPSLIVVGHNELASDVNIRSLGTIRI